MRSSRPVRAREARALLAVLTCLATCQTLKAAERHVPSEFPTIQAAIDATSDTDVVVLAPMTFTGPGNRDVDLLGKAITVRSSDPNDPNLVAATVVDCQATSAQPHRAFVFQSGEGPGTQLIGLTLTNGYAPPLDTGPAFGLISAGGAVLCRHASPTISRCVMQANFATVGSAVMCFDHASPQITDCAIVGNANGSGAICCHVSSSPTLERCTVAENAADLTGGGITCSSDSSPTVRDCEIRDNAAVFGGGGVWCIDDCNPLFTRCVIAGNSTPYSGGGVLSARGSRPVFQSCLIVGNACDGEGGGISSTSANGLEILSCTLVGNIAGDDTGGAAVGYASTVAVRDSIFWDNVPRQVWPMSSAVTFCDIQAGSAGGGPGNIDADPQFVDPDGPDDDPATWQDNDYHLSAASPCVDAGDPNGDHAGLTDLDGESRLIGQIVDMGADERSGPVERHVPAHYETIQDAIDLARNGDTVVVAEGTYRGAGNRNLDFHGKGITVRGSDPNDPNVVAATIIDCQGTEAEPHRGFVFHSHEGPDAVVAGLTITNGRGAVEIIDGPWGTAPAGGAVYCRHSSPALRQCVIRNGAARFGGGICAVDESSPSIVKCVIEANSAGPDGLGGGVFLFCDGTPLITRTLIRGNTARDGGGVFFVTKLTIQSCIIADNVATGDGGGIFFYLGFGSVIANCTIAANSATDPAARGGGISDSLGDDLALNNVILWGNTPTQISDFGPTVTYSDVQGGASGPGNIDRDPLFKNPSGYDGDPATWQDNDYHIAGRSPCRNAGDPSGDYAGQTDVDGDPRVLERRVDIGADERPRPKIRRVPEQYATIQSAIDASYDEDVVLLAPGAYTGDGNRDLDFRKKAITVQSRFPRDPDTVAATVIDCQGDASEPHRGFAFHLGEGPDSVVAGLTVMNGYGPRVPIEIGFDPDPNGYPAGGAVYCIGSSPTITDCSLTDSAALFGGAVCCLDGSSPVIARCEVTRNEARYGGVGGGILCINDCSPEISNCHFSGNQAFYGSAICLDGSAMIANCMVVGNQAYWGGGGIVCMYPSNVTITNCTIVRNIVEGGWSPFSAGGIYTSSPLVTITNCLLWENDPPQIQADSAEPAVTYCNIQGGWPGETNIDEDPRFVDPNGPDGDPNTWEDNDYHLDLGSPCINAGDPNGDYADQTDIDGQRRVIAARVDIGADEWSHHSWSCGDGVAPMLPLAALGMLAVVRNSRRARSHR
ncbi:MAG: right-handed parallel beta-helix repeat-containing protein [Phycisphaerae bacterium]|nr:right-handed parallel beta-helix repeat-containing protein [Phycisphaerae bacterium]